MDRKLRAQFNHGDNDSDLLYLSEFPDLHTGLGLNGCAARYDTSRHQVGIALHLFAPFELRDCDYELALGHA